MDFLLYVIGITLFGMCAGYPSMMDWQTRWNDPKVKKEIRTEVIGFSSCIIIAVICVWCAIKSN
jgi:hypothetical protein